MLLVIDIGNTNTSLGIYDNDDLIKTFSFSSDIKKTDDEYGIMLLAILNHNNLLTKIQGAIVSSVVTRSFKNKIIGFIISCFGGFLIFSIFRISATISSSEYSFGV